MATAFHLEESAMSMRLLEGLLLVVASIPWTARAAEPWEQAILDRAADTAVADARDLRSAHGKGTFVVRRKVRDEEEGVWSEGTFELFWNHGRCRVDLHLTRHLVRILKPGKEGEERVDLKGERRVILGNEKSGTLVTFSPRIHPTGCQVEHYGSLDEAINFAEFPCRHPAQLWQDVLNVDRLIANLDGDPIRLFDGKDGRIEGRYRVKNSKTTQGAFEIDPHSGYRVTSHAVFVDPPVEQRGEQRLVWRQAESVWFAKELHLTERFGGEVEIRTSVIYTTFSANQKIDDAVFDLKSLEIPARTRELDRSK